MPFANVRILKGKKILHRWYVHPIPYEMTIKEFFYKLINDEISPNTIVKVKNVIFNIN